jgi:hypothetical protein
MKIEIPAFPDNSRIPSEYAFCLPADIGHAAFAPNKNPLIRWSGAPPGTKSFALLVVDVDVPTVGDDVNKEGRTVPASLPRTDFYHCVLVDIPLHISEIPEAAESTGVTAKGKPLGQYQYGVRGINDYTSWFAGDPAMSGNYGGYDGPCPPWNDERIHRYHFTIHALDVDTLGLAGAFGGADAVAAMDGHVLAKATYVGTYTLNPALL